MALFSVSARGGDVSARRIALAGGRSSAAFGLGKLLKIAECILRQRKERRDAAVLTALTPEQASDCGIDIPDLPRPGVEVPEGVMGRLMNLR